MKIFEINELTIPTIAKLMSTAKPEWWDYDGALGQLSAPGTIGWYLA